LWRDVGFGNRKECFDGDNGHLPLACRWLVWVSLRHKGREFSETDREYFQNLLYRSESAEAAQRRIDGELASLAKRIGENTQALAASLNTTRDAGEPAFGLPPSEPSTASNKGQLIFF
jgi:hypothetical protein